MPSDGLLPPSPEGIPGEMKALSRWVVWRLEEKRNASNGEVKKTKIPFDPKARRYASTTDPTTWSSFEVALNAYKCDSFDGLGFVFCPEDGLVGIDLDNALACGKPTPQAREILSDLNTYTERSVRGFGAHAIGRGTLPPGRRKSGSIEIYDRERFFVVTGVPLDGYPREIREINPAAIDRLLARMNEGRRANTHDSPPGSGSRPPTEGAGSRLSDDKLIEKAMSASNGAKFRELWEGGDAGLPSPSEGDLALCSLIAFWTGPDPARVDLLFRQSRRMREKWVEQRGEDTYGRRTIMTALDGMTTFYGAGPGTTAEPDLSVLDGLVERAEKKASVLDDTKIIDALAYLAATKAGQYEDVARSLRKAKIRSRAFEPRVQRRAKEYRASLSAGEGDDLQPRAEVEWRSECETYFIQAGCFCRVKSSKVGQDHIEIPIPISNFVAKVIEDVTRDDGLEEKKLFAVEGSLSNKRPLPRREVSAPQFEGLAWLPTEWGVEPSALPGQKDHVSYVMRLYSGDVPRRVIYGHLGFRRIPTGIIYLHAGGTIGAEGIEVDVAHEGLHRYILPQQGGDAREAMRVSLWFLKAGSEKVMYPAWALPWRAALCEFLLCTVMPHWVGGTGKLKSSLAAAIIAHHGEFRSKEDLPGRWEFTDNILEKTSFLAKDVVFVIDDLNPETTRVRKEELERRFSRLAASVGNVTGRRRMGRDLSTRLEYYPRGLVLSTGEYTPTLASSRLARIFPVPFDDCAVDSKKLGEIQKQLEILPHAMRAYVEHIRTQGDGFRERLKEKFEGYRERASELKGLHSRLPENVAHLALGLELGLAFAVVVGAIEEAEAKQHFERGWKALCELAREHGRVIGEERPVTAFLATIAEALAQGRAWLADRGTGRLVSGDAGVGSEKIGWADDEGIYLLPAASYKFAAGRLEYRGGLQVSERALHKLLEEEGHLLRSPSESDRLTPKRWCEGSDHRILWLRPKAIALPPAKSRETRCYRCGSDLSIDINEHCPSCRWLVCSCGACGCHAKAGVR